MESQFLKELEELRLNKGEQNIRNNLVFNNGRLNLGQSLNKIIHQKQFEKFNFYFSKPINEVLCHIVTEQSVLYKDLQVFDDKHEFLKRPYLIAESTSRIKQLAEFFQTYSTLHPNLSTIEQSKNMIKLKDKICYINKLKKDKGGNENNEKMFATKELEEKEIYDMKNKILNSDFKEKLEKSYKNYPSRYDEKSPVMRDPHIKNENYLSDRDSFDSDSFDIYNPGNSIETLSSSELKELIDQKSVDISLFNDKSQKFIDYSIRSNFDTFKDEIILDDNLINLSQQSDFNNLNLLQDLIGKDPLVQKERKVQPQSKQSGIAKKIQSKQLEYASLKNFKRQKPSIESDQVKFNRNQKYQTQYAIRKKNNFKQKQLQIPKSPVVKSQQTTRVKVNQQKPTQYLKQAKTSREGYVRRNYKKVQFPSDHNNNQDYNQINKFVRQYKKSDAQSERGTNRHIRNTGNNYYREKKSQFIVRNAKQGNGRSLSHFQNKTAINIDHRRDYQKLKEKIKGFPRNTKPKIKVKFKNKQKKQKGKDKIIIKRQLKSSQSNVDIKSYSTYTSEQHVRPLYSQQKGLQGTTAKKLYQNVLKNNKNKIQHQKVPNSRQQQFEKIYGNYQGLVQENSGRNPEHQLNYNKKPPMMNIVGLEQLPIKPQKRYMNSAKESTKPSKQPYYLMEEVQQRVQKYKLSKDEVLSKDQRVQFTQSLSKKYQQRKVQYKKNYIPKQVPKNKRFTSMPTTAKIQKQQQQKKYQKNKADKNMNRIYIQGQGSKTSRQFEYF